MAIRMTGAPAAPPIDNLAAWSLPVVTTAAAAVFTVQPIPIPGYAALTPALILMAVFHWTLYRPDLLPPLAIFLTGAAFDLVSGGPPGLTALVLLATRAVVLRYRRWIMDRSFPFVWGGFALLSSAAMLWRWMLHVLLDGGAVELRDSIFRTVLTIAFFPIASYLLGRTQWALMGGR